MRRRTLLLACILGLAASAAAAQTTISGTITANSEWTLAGSPYIAAHGFTVGAGVTLTVDPGVVVELGAGQSATVNGTLSAVGAGGSTIVFTSTSGTSSNPWSAIIFNAGSAGRLSDVTVSYAGSAANSLAGAIDVYTGAGGTLEFDNLTVSSSASSGIFLYGTASAITLSSATITGSAYYGVVLVDGATAAVSATNFTNNGTYTMSIDASCSLSALSGLTASGNGGGAKNGIEHRGGAITTLQTWPAGGLDWYLTAAPSVAANGALTIAAGATVHLGSSANLNVSGNLTAVGTGTSPITFTSFSATTPGTWGAIVFNSGSSGHLSYVTASYGGAGGSWTAGAIDVNGGTGSAIEFDNLTVNASGSSGIAVNGTSAALGLSSATIESSAYYGVILLNGATANVSATALTNNGAYALSVDGASSLAGLGGLAASGNGGGAKNGIEYRGGTITAAAAWLPGLDWYLTASPVIAGNGGALTIGAGATLHLHNGESLNVSGNLTAVGTSASPITFTTFSGSTPGSWGAILFNGGSSGHLSYVNVAYGGSGGSLTGGTINVNGGAGGTIEIDNLTLTASAGSGIVVNGTAAALTLTDATISGSAYDGLVLLNGAAANVTQSTFSGNIGYPLSTAAGCPLSGLAALTLTGNGSGGTRNGIEHRGGTIVAPISETWIAGFPWYLTGSVGVNAGATLTLSAGLTVNAANGTGISVAGALLAQGTATLPIALLPLNPTPYPGVWNGLAFSTGGLGQVAYTSVSYAGVQVSWATPTFDHVAVADAPNYGFNVSGPPTPLINNCAMAGNVHGVNASSSTAVDARLTYWGAASGPSGSGPGGGQSVSTSVLFEPWLVAAPSAPQYFTSFAQTDRTFNPIPTAAPRAWAGTPTAAWSGRPTPWAASPHTPTREIFW